MPESLSPLPAVVTLRSSLRTIDEQLSSGSLTPDRVEDIKSAVDDIRFRLWGVLTASSPAEYQAFRERFRLRRATAICHALAIDIHEQRLTPTHREATELREALQELLARLPGSCGRGHTELSRTRSSRHRLARPVARGPGTGRGDLRDPERRRRLAEPARGSHL